jgi:hypothetical protein
MKLALAARFHGVDIDADRVPGVRQCDPEERHSLSPAIPWTPMLAPYRTGSVSIHSTMADFITQ